MATRSIVSRDLHLHRWFSSCRCVIRIFSHCEQIFLVRLCCDSAGIKLAWLPVTLCFIDNGCRFSYLKNWRDTADLLHLRIWAIYRVAQNKIPHEKICNISATSGLIFSERCRLCRCPSVCRLSVVCNVGAPYSDDWNFPQCFYAIWYLGHPWPVGKNCMEIVPGEPLHRGVKHKRGSQI